MRIDLETIEKIERYLMGKMNPDEVLAFEKEINTHAELKQAVEQQKDLMKAMEKTYLKKTAVKAGQTVRMFSILKKGGIVVTILVVLAIAYVGYTEIKKQTNKNENSNEQNIVIPDIEKGTVYDPGKFIPSQYFEIDGSKDTVIVGNNGVMVAIPAGSFVDENNNPVTSKINFELKEALDPGTIMMSGLSTFSNDQPLETGGMFYINATSNGKELKIGEGGILTSVPQAESKPGMMMFDGVVQADGSINWVNPKETESFLLPIDMRALDFYPEGYVDKLKEMELEGHLNYENIENTEMQMVQYNQEHINGNYESKKYRDSLYLSFECQLPTGLSNQPKDTLIADLDTTKAIKTDTIMSINSELYFSCGISPSKVLAFWQPSFNNTYLATKEFESRMKLIHKTCNNAILDLYVNNIDKKLYEVDSMAALMAGGLAPEFLKFAAMKQGRVQNGDKKHILLKNFYQRQSMVFAEAAIKTTNKFFERNQKADLYSMQQSIKANNRNFNNTQKLYEEEYQLNLKEAYKQLGYKKPNIRFSNETFTATITSTGWKNVDAYVAESLIARTTLDYTDTNGRKAVINFKSMDLTITNESDFDMVNVYLIPDKLTTYMKVKQSDGKYTESLNELINYDMVAIGYKNKQIFYQLKENLAPASYSFVLASSEVSTVNEILSMMRNPKVKADLRQAMDFSIFQVADQERKNRYNKVVAYREILRPIVFPCVDMPISSEMPKDSTAVAQ